MPIPRPAQVAGNKKPRGAGLGFRAGELS